jgi:hypothetical protein
LKITPHFKFIVQCSIVQYSISTVQYWYYRYLDKKLELNKIYFILFEKFFH